MEEGVVLQVFTPAKAHLSFREVYSDFPHHNDGTHLLGGVPDNATWKIYWRRLALQSASWYSTPLVEVGHRFSLFLAAEWQGVINQKYTYKRPLVFAHTVLTKALGTCNDRKILKRSGQLSTTNWTSGRGTYTQDWWGMCCQRTDLMMDMS